MYEYHIIGRHCIVPVFLLSLNLQERVHADILAQLVVICEKL